MLLIELLKTQIDQIRPAPTAGLGHLAGANVTVPVGSPWAAILPISACVATDQIGCVVAYSSFEATPHRRPFRPDRWRPGQLSRGVGPAGDPVHHPAALGVGGVLIQFSPPAMWQARWVSPYRCLRLHTFVSYSGRSPPMPRVGGADWLGSTRRRLRVGRRALAGSPFIQSRWGFTPSMSISLGHLVNWCAQRSSLTVESTE